MTNTQWPAGLRRSILALLLLAAPLVAFADDAPAKSDPPPDPTNELTKQFEQGPLAPTKTLTPTARPSTPATAQPANAKGPKTPEQFRADTNKLFDFLMSEYRTLLTKSKDRMGRSLAIVCLARVSRADATAELLNLLKSERDPLVRMTAWQSLLARANGLRESEWKAWYQATAPLFAAGAFRGDLRVPLLHMLALAPPDAFGKEAFSRIFRETNSTDREDHPTIAALGETLRAWGEPNGVEALLSQLTDVNNAPRAEAVLRAAGADVVQMAMSRRELGSVEMWKQAKAEYENWWAKAKPTWKPITARAESGEWQKLAAQYVPRVDMAEAVDPTSKQWYKDLELRAPQLKTFSVGLLVDTTGSMNAVLVWLRADVKRMMSAFGVIALEPQIGLTFYRDKGDAFISKTVPLTGRTDRLANALAMMDAKGGGDVPESVLEALQDSLANGGWPTSKNQPKAMVLIGDAPPHPQSQAECEKVVADAAANGLRLYTVKVLTGYEGALGAFDKLAEAGKGQTLWADMRNGGGNNAAMGYARRGGMGGGGGPGMGGGMGRWNRMARDARDAAGGQADDQTPGEWIVTKVITDAINPEYGDRVRQPVGILWQMLKEPIAEKHDPFPPPAKNMSNPTPTNRTKPKPKDVQAQ